MSKPNRIYTCILSALTLSLLTVACQGTSPAGPSNQSQGQTSNSSNNNNSNSGSSSNSGNSSSTPDTGSEEPSSEDPAKPLTVANSSLFNKGTQEFFKIIGTPGSDEMMATLAATKDGTVIFAGHHTQVLDGFSNDLLVGAMGSDGSLKWLKSFNGNYHQQFKDVGQNAQTGGTQHSLVVGPDDFIYLVAEASPAVQNNLFYTMVLKIDPKSGEMVWGKLWNPSSDLATAKTNAEAFGLDVDQNHVYVTGSTGANKDQSESNVELLALNTSDGSVFYQKAFDPNPGYTDRGYVIKLDGKGGAYIGGNGNGRALLVHLNDVSGSSPKLDWVKQPGLGIGGNINAVDVDPEGNVYASLDRRGATTYFSAAKFDITGEVSWAKTYEGTAGDRNNTHMVRVIGDYVYVGGRTGQPNFDTSAGDGLLVRLKKQDGAFDWATFHFSGTASDVLAEHRVKQVLMVGNDFYIGGQVYTGNNNGSVYEGRWLNGRDKLVDYDQLIVSDLGMPELIDLPASKLQDSSLVGKWVNTPKVVVLQNGTDKKNGSPPDGELFISKMRLK